MAGDLYLLTREDVLFLKEMARAYKHTARNTRNRLEGEEIPEVAPEVYVSRLPAGGIPAPTSVGTGSPPSSESPNYVVCPIWRLSLATGQLEEMPGYTRNVYSLAALAGNLWVLIERDKYGIWWAVAPVGGGSSGSTSFWARLTDQQADGSPIYSFTQVEDTTPPSGWVVPANPVTGTFNAEEVNGKCAVPTETHNGTGKGAIVRMRPSDGKAGWYEFEYESPGFWAKITGQLSSSVNTYSFAQVTDPTPPNTWTTLSGGFTGTNNAEEIHGNIYVPTNAIVRMWESDGKRGWYEFSYEALKTQNVDNTQVMDPTFVVVANNLDDIHKFGRLYFSSAGSNKVQLDWQGQRVYHAGDGLHGPEPDLEFQDNAPISWTITDDTTDQRLQIKPTIATQAPPGTEPGGSTPWPVPTSLVWLGTWNLATPYNLTYPTLGIVAHNDLTSTAQNGRILFTAGSGVNLGQTQIDWQGLRLYQAGTGYVGPEPDVELVAGTGISISIADDTANKCVQATISATAGSLTVENLDGTAVTTPTTTIKADNSVGGVADTTHKFGRVIWSQLTANSGQLDWQGLRLYQAGVGYKGPEPDLELIAGSGISISINDDTANQKVQATIASTASGSTTGTNGESDLNADFTLSSTSTTVTGMSITLPAAGTYYVQGLASGQLLSSVAFANYITIGLYNNTTGTVIANSQAWGCYTQSTNNTIGETIPTASIITVTGATTIVMQASIGGTGSGVGSLRSTGSGGGGATKLLFIRLS